MIKMIKNKTKEMIDKNLFYKIIITGIYKNPNFYNISIGQQTNTVDMSDETILDEIDKKYAKAWEKLAE